MASPNLHRDQFLEIHEDLMVEDTSNAVDSNIEDVLFAILLVYIENY
jgi:hypothetical protein